ncbi:hypothetical protein [Herpetosiphon gulosus]|uniref:Uncharacterized protein n=1 Tax=Herpetosiphon gulosus TaxID=1973496 RepID=A0ABP9X0H5_9CHLR
MLLTEEQVADLIYTPEKVLDQPPITQLMLACGGIQQWYELLKTISLKEAEQRLLLVILAQPGASVDDYLQQLHIHKATFHRHQRKLIASLTHALNHHPLFQTTSSGFEQLQRAARLPASVAVDRSLPAYQRMLQLLGQGVRLINVVGDDWALQQQLVLAVAHEVQATFQDGCLWIDLTNRLEQALVMRLLDYGQFKPALSAAELSQLFQGRHGLLILLGYQAHPDDALWLRRLLEIAPKLIILCTSSQRLKLYGEFLVPISSLPPR